MHGFKWEVRKVDSRRPICRKQGMQLQCPCHLATAAVDEEEEEAAASAVAAADLGRARAPGE